MPRGETSNVADGLENVVAAETVLSKVDGEAGVLILRGHYLQDIAGRRSFEWLTGLLWQDFVDRPLGEAELRRDLGLARERAFAQMRELLPVAGRLSPLAAVRLLLASVPDDADDAPLLLTATVAVGLAAAIRIRDGKPPVAPDPQSGHAADFLRMLKGTPPTPDEAAALDTYLVTAADHGLNASTFTARVAASTRASLTDAVTAALCALKGPLHGGAPGPVLDMLDAIGPAENAEAWLDAAVMRGDRLMGFGHRIYRVQDPRSDVVKAVVRAAEPRHRPAALRRGGGAGGAGRAGEAQAEPLAADQSGVLHGAAAGGAWPAARCVHRRVRGCTRGGLDRARAGAAGRRTADPAAIGRMSGRCRAAD